MKHGHAAGGQLSPTYMSWRSMWARIAGNTEHRRRYYSGITVCDRWKVFANFLTDMGERPAGTTLDRNANDGHYEPGNCQWATRSQQMKNRRKMKRKPKTHCRHGHEFTPENTLIRKDNGFRQCRLCAADRLQAWHANQIV
jgi:hypothetical protein